ncbi:B12-binding domain-containing radical SAM protein [Azospirillum sp. sgz302134]
MQRILLVCVGHDEGLSPWAYLDLPRFLRQKAFMAPLHLATIAALTPEDIEVRIWDEPVHGFIDENTDLGGSYDLVGLTGFSSHMERAVRIARILRGRGLTVAAGGPGVTAAPEAFREHFDHLFIGEAELTWPKFLEDVKAGCAVQEYRSPTLPDLALSPPPRWDSIADVMKGNYVTGGIQVTRGCPFNCEFCGVWQTFGRKMRTKPIEQVLEELRTMHRLGMESVLFCADNFVGDRAYAKELLRAVTPVNNGFERPMTFAAELDITIARDPEMMELLADANFSGLLIGIETPNKESLIEIRKRQNLRGSLVDTCRTIQSYGVPIDGSIIVGFDHDTVDTFDLQFEFLQQSCIPIPRMHMLKAIAGTELRERLVRDGRVLDIAKLTGDTGHYLDANVHCNILPAGMSRVELLSGYLRLVERIFDWTNFEERMYGFIDNVTRPPQVPERVSAASAAEGLKSLFTRFPEHVQPHIGRILAHAEKNAPYMVTVVGRLIFRHFFESARVPAMREAIHRQIALEESLGDATVRATTVAA